MKMSKFWGQLFQKTNFDTEDFVVPTIDGYDVEFASPEEVAQQKTRFNTSASPDGVTPAMLEKLATRVRAKIYTCWQLMQWAPSFVIDSRTIFIPKKEEADQPAKLRPLSISSVVIRQFHKILAARLMKKLKFSDFQFGFQKFDEVARGIQLLNDILTSRKNVHPLTGAVLDLEKAFDSVDHNAIFRSLCANGVSRTQINYLRYIYGNAKTFPCFKGKISNPILPSRGVRQGDPLSPLLFMLVFDKVIQQIPAFEGFHHGGGCINHLAYADDLVLLASEPASIQNILDTINPLMKTRGLVINSGKSNIFCWLKDGKRKRMLYDAKVNLRVSGRPLLALKPEEFKYLCVVFTPKGHSAFTISIQEDLKTLKNAPLKPQQKLFPLRNHLIPRYYHKMLFAKLYAGAMNKLDVAIRHFVRLLLHLPEDVPAAVFHANTAEGGLGDPLFR